MQTKNEVNIANCTLGKWGGEEDSVCLCRWDCCTSSEAKQNSLFFLEILAENILKNYQTPPYKPNYHPLIGLNIEITHKWFPSPYIKEVVPQPATQVVTWVKLGRVFQGEQIKIFRSEPAPF